MTDQQQLCDSCDALCCRCLAWGVREDASEDAIKQMECRGKVERGYWWIPAVCKHLAFGRCQIYETRPDECRAYKVGGDMCRLTREVMG